MQRAAEQMRSAASEMQRQNAGGAAASGEKAADALRQLEQQMRGSSADARQRTAGELRLEAQQIADAQRRIAAEAARLEKERTGSGTDRATADALRRLAAEKDKLADRVDRLQEGARDAERSRARRRRRAAARGGGGSFRASRRVPRMRESAQQLRDRAAARNRCLASRHGASDRWRDASTRNASSSSPARSSRSPMR